MHHDIIPYRERTLSDSPTIPARVREIQDIIIHGELIHRRKRQAAATAQPDTAMNATATPIPDCKIPAPSQ